MNLLLSAELRDAIVKHLDLLVYSGRTAAMDVAQLRAELLRLQEAAGPSATSSFSPTPN